MPGLSTFPYHTDSKEKDANNVLHWLKRAKDESIETTINITVTKKNFHELYETIANGLIAGADTVLLNRFLIGGRGITYQDELALSRAELREMLDIAENVLTQSKRIGSVGTEYPLCLIPKQGDMYKQLRVGSLCAATKEFFVIDPSGYIRICNHSPKRLGYIFDDTIISDEDYWNTFVNRTYNLPSMCEGCYFIDNCDCGCREAAAICHGSLSALDPCFSS
jgi:radical SAM protein with 4Fe4S-binding SPASM domain